MAAHYSRGAFDPPREATEWTGAYNTIGGYVDPRTIRRSAGSPERAALHDDRLEFFPIVQTPAADGGPCKCR